MNMIYDFFITKHELDRIFFLVDIDCYVKLPTNDYLLEPEITFLNLYKIRRQSFVDDVLVILGIEGFRFMSVKNPLLFL